MAKHKPVTDDELARMCVRVEDIQAGAKDFTRRMSSDTTTPPELPIDRAMTMQNAGIALLELSTVLLRRVWLNENRVEPKAMFDTRVAPGSETAITK